MRTKIAIGTRALWLVICFIFLLSTGSQAGDTWKEINGQSFGAKPDDKGPIGGGHGYKTILLDGTHIVKDIDGLQNALKRAKYGEVVYIDRNAEIDCTDLVFTDGFQIKIPAGVTLAGDRGHKGSEGAIIRSESFATNPLIRVLGPGARITGLRIIGPDPKPRLEHHKRAFNPQRGDSEVQHKYYYLFPNSVGIASDYDSLEVDNCELSGWSYVAVHLKGGERHYVHHNYIHHNQRHGLGYGVCLGYGKNVSALIEYNLFNYNRHSIAGEGEPRSSYEARNNIELGNSLGHNFDMHGIDRGDGTNIAGDQIKLHHNTFLDEKVRPIAIRGVPQKGALIYNNWFAHKQPGKEVILPWPISEKENIQFYNNLFGRENPVVIDQSAK